MSNTDMTYVFKCVGLAWGNLTMQACWQFAIAPSKIVQAKCCVLHLKHANRCLHAVDFDDVSGLKPFIAVYFFWGSGADLAAYNKIKEFTNNRIISGCDNACYHAGEWVGLGDAPAVYVKGVDAKELPATEFLSLISNKYYLLNDYGSGVWNFYKYIFISSAVDPRVLYRSCYAKVDGLQIAMSKMNIFYSIHRGYGYRAREMKWSDAPDEYADCLFAAKGKVLGWRPSLPDPACSVCQEVILDNWLKQKRLRDAKDSLDAVKKEIAKK